MKVFQVRFSTVLILSLSLLASGILSIPNSSAQEDTEIPDWIKNVAGWWANDEISENEFLTGIEYMINNNIISINFTPCSTGIGNQHSSSANLVPDWVKNNAGWWATDLIEDSDFINGIEYLIKIQVITIDGKNIQGVDPEDVVFSPAWKISKNNLVNVSSAFFEIYGTDGDCTETDDGTTVWRSLWLGVNQNEIDKYKEVAVWDDPQKTVVVYPFFTYTAYAEPGFYTYYRGECDDCITTKLVPSSLTYNTSGIGHQALTLLGYTPLNDIEIDKNPDILKQFDKIIMLHNEYVTRTMFDAITNHPNVVYLYPNALYAEIEVDYVEQTMTLIRGHNYPEPEITNGFDWEFDNTHPAEYDSECLTMQIYKITNGWMTNCYPENVFLKSDQAFDLLKTIKDL